MNLMQLILLGVGYKILTSQSAAAAPAAAPAASPSTGIDATTATDVAAGTNALTATDPQTVHPEGVITPGLVTPVQSATQWTGDTAVRAAALSMQAVPVADAGNSNGLSTLESYYASSALPAESDPLSVGAKENQLAAQSQKAAAYVQGEQAADQKVYDAEVTAEYYDVSDASPADLVAYKAKMDARFQKGLARDAAAARRSAQLAMDSDISTARMNEARSRAQAKMLAKSIAQPVDPNLDQALQQPWTTQAARGFTKAPDAGFVDAQPVSFRDGNFSQSEIIPSDDFNNHLTAEDFGFRDYPRFSRQQGGGVDSDFSGVLLNEAGSADFAQNIVYNVKEDFGGRR